MSDPDRLNEYRVFHLTAQTILPLLRDMHTIAEHKMISKFRSGNHDLVAEVAKVEAIHSLIEDITHKAKAYERLASKGE